jgi:cytochrome c-type biogenesis protein CcmE
MEAAPPPVRRRNWKAIVLLVVVLVAGGIVVTKFLTSAIDFYCNVDEVGHKSGCEAGRRLRIQGTVDEGSVEKNGAVTDFRITFNGVTRRCTTKVIRADCSRSASRWSCTARSMQPVSSTGDKLEVKHTNEYAAKNPDRLDPTKSAACSQAQA